MGLRICESGLEINEAVGCMQIRTGSPLAPSSSVLSEPVNGATYFQFTQKQQQISEFLLVNLAGFSQSNRNNKIFQAMIIHTYTFFQATKPYHTSIVLGLMKKTLFCVLRNPSWCFKVIENVYSYQLIRLNRRFISGGISFG